MNPFGSNNSLNNLNNTSNNNLNNNMSGLFGNNNNSATSLYSNPNKSTETFMDNAQTNADSSGIITSMQDNSLNLYNLTVKEIIEKQTTILNKNIEQFEKSVKHVLEQDMKLIAAKTNYVNVQNKLKMNTNKMNELLEGLDFFEKELTKKLDAQEKEDGKLNFDTKKAQTAEVLDDFEFICDKFYEKVEGFEDENNGVMDLINENYEYIEKIDALLDSLSYKMK